MNSSFTYFDVHTHKKYIDADVAFIRNAFHHLSILQLNQIPYHFSVGLHPWDVRAHYEASLLQVKTSAQHPRCVAIGECGLDYFIKTDRELQKKVFSEHLRIAEENHKPLIIHCVRAYHDLWPMLKNSNVPAVLHHFTGNADITERFLQNPNIYFSFGKQLFSEHLQPDIFSMIPLHRILFETDTHSRHIEDVYEKAALLFDLDFEDLVNQIKKNAQGLFLTQ